MSCTWAKMRILSYGVLVCLISSCYHPPYNNFKPDNRAARQGKAGAVTGSAVGLIASGTLTGTLIGGAVGGTVGALTGAIKDSKYGLVKQLNKENIEFVEYGDSMTLVIPTDKYFHFLSPRLNELCYPGLVNTVKLLKLYPETPIYVAGFTDNVGSKTHKKLMSQAQAETILSYLWANGIKSARLKAEGYGDLHDVSDNKLIHGSAQNRRIEIQWFTHLVAQAEPVMFTK